MWRNLGLEILARVRGARGSIVAFKLHFLSTFPRVLDILAYSSAPVMPETSDEQSMAWDGSLCISVDSLADKEYGSPKSKFAKYTQPEGWVIPSGQLSSDSDSDTVEDQFIERLQKKSCAVGDPPPLKGTEAVYSQYNTTFLGGSVSVDEFAQSMIEEHGLEDSFYVLDLGVVAKLYNGWKSALPRVTPFYAVKCNPNVPMLALLAALGAGFDCASETEIETVMSLGVPAERIIYAHPVKPNSHIRYARRVGVDLCTFDTESELQVSKNCSICYYQVACLVLTIGTAA